MRKKLCVGGTFRWQQTQLFFSRSSRIQELFNSNTFTFRDNVEDKVRRTQNHNKISSFGKKLIYKIKANKREKINLLQTNR